MSGPAVTIGPGSGGIGTSTITCQLYQSSAGPVGANNTYNLPTVTNPNSIMEQTEQALVSGNNTITVPSGAQGVFICPPNLNQVGWTLKGAAGDTGIPSNTQDWDKKGFPNGAAPANIVINAAGALNMLFLWY